MPIMDSPMPPRARMRVGPFLPSAAMVLFFVGLIALLEHLEDRRIHQHRVLTIAEIQKAVASADRCEKDMILSQTDGQDLEHLTADVVDGAKSSCAQSEAAYAESETDKQRNAMIYQALKN